MILRCRVPGCRSKFVALTGLQELQKIITHLRRVHLANVTMEEALELRVKWENEQEAEEKKQQEHK